MEFQLSYFKSWKTMLWKCCTQYASKFGKLSSDHRTGEGQFSFQCQRMLKLPHIVLISQASKVMLKILQANLQQCTTSRCSSWISKRQRNQKSNCQHLLHHREIRRIPEKHLLVLYWLCQRLWLCGSQQTAENSSRDGNTRSPDLPPEKSVCRSRSNS